MNCIAIDDEPLALNVIKEFCQKIDFVNLIGTFTNALEAIPEINKKDIDLIFLDIEMPDITGFEFVKTLPNPPLIIFTTAFSKYAINGFELNIIDFLLKPIAFDKFLKAINKASMQLSIKNKNAAGQIQIKNNSPDEYFFVKAGYSIVKINFDEISYIEGLKDYVKIYINEKSLVTKGNIKNIENKLPSDLFARVHKSYIISIDKIEKIEDNHIFIGSKKIPIGLQFKDSFYDKINRFRI